MIRPIIAGIDTVAAMPIPIDTRAERARMPAPTILLRNSYVYLLFDWLGIPFYAGKGRGRRYLDHAAPAASANNPRKLAIAQETLRVLGEIPSVKIAEHLSHFEALALEEVFVTAIGRYPHGPLTNLTDGGDGVHDATGEVAAKIAASLTGFKHSPAARENMRRSHMGHKVGLEQREKMRIALTGRKRPSETRQRISEATLGREISQTVRAAVSKRFKGVPKPPEQRAKMAVAAQGRIPSAETREKLRVANLGKHHSEEHKAKIRANARRGPHTEQAKANMRAALASEEVRAKMSATHKGKPKSPEHRLKMLEAAKKSADVRRGKKLSPAHLKKLSEAHKMQWKKKRLI
jgi:hypothetical protein